MMRSETLIELKFLNSSFRVYPLTEITQTAPCRAIGGNSISVNSTLHPYAAKREVSLYTLRR